MPVFNAGYHRVAPGVPIAPNPSGLVFSGPVVNVQIEVPDALAAQMRSASVPIPPPTIGLAMIDTGATFSAADAGVLASLGLQPAGSVNVWGVGGATQQSQFPAKLSFPGTQLPTLHFSQIAGATLAGMKLPGFNIPLIALIGRDILAHCVLVYNGPAANFSLSL